LENSKLTICKYFRKDAIMEYLLSRDYLFWVPLICLVVGYILVINMARCLARDKGENFSSMYVIIMAVLALVAMLFIGAQDLFNYGFRVVVSFSAIFSVNALFSSLIVAIASVSWRTSKLAEIFTMISLVFTTVSLLLTTVTWVWKYFC